jgi:hypothetical protein
VDFQTFFACLTYSVFRDENEAVVAEICRNNDLVCEAQTLITGIEKRADCLFVSVLKKIEK